VPSRRLQQTRGCRPSPTRAGRLDLVYRFGAIPPSRCPGSRWRSYQPSRTSAPCSAASTRREHAVFLASGSWAQGWITVMTVLPLTASSTWQTYSVLKRHVRTAERGAARVRLCAICGLCHGSLTTVCVWHPARPGRLCCASRHQSSADREASCCPTAPTESQRTFHALAFDCPTWRLLHCVEQCPYHRSNAHLLYKFRHPDARSTGTFSFGISAARRRW